MNLNLIHTTAEFSTVGTITHMDEIRHEVKQSKLAARLDGQAGQNARNPFKWIAVISNLVVESIRERTGKEVEPQCC
jgi:hypothetical protein